MVINTLNPTKQGLRLLVGLRSILNIANAVQLFINRTQRNFKKLLLNTNLVLIIPLSRPTLQEALGTIKGQLWPGSSLPSSAGAPWIIHDLEHGSSSALHSYMGGTGVVKINTQIPQVFYSPPSYQTIHSLLSRAFLHLVSSPPQRNSTNLFSSFKTTVCKFYSRFVQWNKAFRKDESMFKLAIFLRLFSLFEKITYLYNWLFPQDRVLKTRRQIKKSSFFVNQK